MRLHIDAAQLREHVLTGAAMGPLELQLWQLIAATKVRTRGKTVFVRLEFDAEAGGVVIECAKPNWLGRLCWLISPTRLFLGA